MLLAVRFCSVTWPGVSAVKSIVSALVRVVIAVCLAATLGVGVFTGAAEHQGAGTAETVTLVNASVPQRAWETLARIDAGEWPPNDGSGTKGGGVWSNREHNLPASDASGAPITYREWDVNIKQSGQNRDAERIVTGTDTSAWYTADHYATFTRMR